MHLKTKFVSIIFSVFLIVSSSLAASANDDLNYYPKEFFKILEQKESIDLKEFIFKVLQNSHLRKNNGNDLLVGNCENLTPEQIKDCYTQKSIDYSTARKYLFGKLHLIKTSEGMEIEDVYCHKKVVRGVGPMTIPSDKVLNCEHSWPQSKFNYKFPNGLQKGDLHHLFPSDPVANSTRGNHFFGEMPGRPLNDCDSSSIGDSSEDGNTYFEPPKEHKGNVARALFYFSVRYQLPINDTEEAFLRSWNKEDPIDQAEQDRNDEIYKIQGNRNPFIDFPGLADEINNF